MISPKRKIIWESLVNTDRQSQLSGFKACSLTILRHVYTLVIFKVSKMEMSTEHTSYDNCED